MQETNYSNKMCYHCRKLGHISYNCSKKDLDTKTDDKNKKNDKAGKRGYIVKRTSTSTNTKWVIDSGASDHYCRDKQLFSTFKAITRYNIKIADESVVCVTGVRNVIL